MIKRDLSANTQDLSPRVILVTGGCGFIGSNFIRYILQKHHSWTVINLDKLTYAGNLANLTDIEDRYGHSPISRAQNLKPRYFFIRGDICDRKLVDSLFSGKYFSPNFPAHRAQNLKIDVCINFAAESHVDRSILDASPFIETNIKGTQVLLEAARTHWLDSDSCNTQHSIPNLFVQVSTDEVYGSLGERGLFTEKSPLQPNSLYAASKAAADMLCQAYHKAYGLPVIVARSSNNYGPYQFPEKLIPLMIKNAMEGKELPIYGRGQQIRDWLYVEDNCCAIDTVLQKGQTGEIYNIGGNCEKKNIEVVKLICEIIKDYPETRNLKPRILFITDPRGAAHDFRYGLDCTRIKELGWKPQSDFKKRLRQTIEWYLRNQSWVKSVITAEYEDYYKKIYEKQMTRTNTIFL